MYLEQLFLLSLGNVVLVEEVEIKVKEEIFLGR